MILPGGTVKIGNYEYDVMLNGSPVKVDEFNRMPIKYHNGATVFMGDVAKASDSHAVQTDIARVNGRRATFRYILKHASASTLTVVDAVKGVIPLIQAMAPQGHEDLIWPSISRNSSRVAGRRLAGDFHRLGAGRPDDADFSRLVAQHADRDHVDSAVDSDLDRRRSS